MPTTYLIIALLLVNAAVWLYAYRRMTRPVRVIANGMDLLREQDFSSRLRPVGEREADHIVDVFNRMMDELKNTRLALRERNHLLDLLVEVSPMGVAMLDFDGRITSLNPAARTFLQVDDGFEGKDFGQLGSDLAQRIATLRNEEEQTFSMSDANVYRCTRRTFIDRGFPHPFVLIESLTQDVMAAEREAYGKVIRMLSHEVNNTMAATGSITQTVSDALADQPDYQELREALSACLVRSQQMTAFITRFANVVKVPAPSLRPTPLDQLVTANGQFLESLCSVHHISLHIQLSDAETVLMDEALMAQVLVNIVKNSIESILESGREEGQITITTAARTLTIMDNGAGISSDAASHLFTPFFSTKANGHGIGLLLVREILTRHHCQFSLRTQNGLTRFSVVFPVKE